MWFYLINIFLILLIIFLIKRLNKTYYLLSLCKRVKSADGAELSSKILTIPGKTIFGNNFDVLDMNPETIFQFIRQNNKTTGGKSYMLHFLLSAVYNVINAEDAEEVLQSQNLIKKSVIYKLMEPFLGEGLLTSTDRKWHFRRKTLTPAFHFTILQTFLEVFKEESEKLVTVFGDYIDKTLALEDVIPQFTLNNVCETALGVKLDNVPGSKEYRQSIHAIEPILVHRLCNPLMYYDIIFYLFGDYKKHNQYLKVAHDFSSKVIQKKREEYHKLKEAEIGKGRVQDEFSDIYGKKKRYAMLDTLLAAEAQGQIDHQGICDEVNTFMFEGYDTTSTCLIFTLLNMALRPDIQDKCLKELEHLGNIENLTVFDFNKLEYLECVIKESLRLYPSVPFIARECAKETVINGLVFPAGSQINVHLFDIMRDPKHFDNPTEFRPERFLPENTINRHPFAFVPFSAGPRNCIGQKFAILEIKVLLASLVRKYRFLPVTRLEDITFENGIILRTKQHVHIKIARRYMN